MLAMYVCILAQLILANEASPPDPMGSSAAPGNDSSGLYQVCFSNVSFAEYLLKQS